MAEPLTTGQVEILYSGARRVVRDNYTLIAGAGHEGPADSDVDLLVDVVARPHLQDQLACQLSGKGLRPLPLSALPKALYCKTKPLCS
jgi:hypothetical protein